MPNIFRKHFISFDETWETNFQDVKDYIDENYKLPSTLNVDTDINALGLWLNSQILNYKKNEKSMRTADRMEIWYDFINCDKYKKYLSSDLQIWKNTLQLVKTYISQNDELPSIQNKDIDISSLGLWIKTQRINYNKDKYLSKKMLNREENQLWYEFVNGDW
jgi:hypothetical protein